MATLVNEPCLDQIVITFSFVNVFPRELVRLYYIVILERVGGSESLSGHDLNNFVLM